MITPSRLWRTPVVLVAAVAVLAPALAVQPTLADFQAAATREHLKLELPNYARTPDELKAKANEALKAADAELAALAAQDPAKLTFANTFAAYDAITARVGDVYAMSNTIAESALDQALRDAGNEVNVQIQGWSVGLDYREDVYRALKAVADTKPKLDAESQRLMDEQMRTYRRAGLTLPAAQKAEVEKLRKDLSALTTQFAVNINEARAPLDFTAEELAGVPQSFLESPGVKQPDGKYRVMANITWHATAIAENADNAETRRKVNVARTQLAREKNVPLMKQIVVLRADIAQRLGYASWADYQIEVKMAKNGAMAVKFEEDLLAGLQPKFNTELETLRQLKVQQTGQADAQILAWDVAYYTNRLVKEKYAIDKEELRNFFPYQATLDGMFAIYQKIFGLKFTQIDPPYIWTEGVQLYVVQDAASGVPMGAFYLDMFPREGKFNHFACFPQKAGGVQADGTYDLPVAALMCNFPAPSADKPSLLKHDEVEILFHEFGHVMHAMLSRSRYVAQGGFNVPGDFVEAPSQMLEAWVWDKAVLDTFAADYRDSEKKIPAATIASLVEARQATAGYTTRRQQAFGIMDLALHTLSKADAEKMDVVAVTNAALTRATVAPAPDTAFVAYFGHLAGGYDAGYYGYLWAKVMALDMASVFKAAPGGFLDVPTGMRLRNEVYGVGNTRDVAESVERFLGRPRSQQAFLEDVGVTKK
jgi:thimet oligopeptidase